MLQDIRNRLGAQTVMLHVTGSKEKDCCPDYDVRNPQDLMNGLGALTVILHVTGPKERVCFPGFDVTGPKEWIFCPCYRS